MCDTSELDSTGKQVRPPMNKPDIPVTGGQLIDWAKEQQQLLYLDNARGERKYPQFLFLFTRLSTVTDAVPHRPYLT
ncbi:unnamed protein product [Larinioides sclopetarius]|uniref:Uncharacterized protein n=1 Tax=Larinioides sclopetarius TaxID=280406 RepID=A0AAV2AAQ4_9ARAC